MKTEKELLIEIHALEAELHKLRTSKPRTCWVRFNSLGEPMNDNYMKDPKTGKHAQMVELKPGWIAVKVDTLREVWLSLKFDQSYWTRYLDAVISHAVCGHPSCTICWDSK